MKSKYIFHNELKCTMIYINHMAPTSGVGKLFDLRARMGSKIWQRGRARSIWTRNVIYQTWELKYLKNRQLNVQIQRNQHLMEKDQWNHFHHSEHIIT